MKSISFFFFFSLSLTHTYTRTSELLTYVFDPFWSSYYLSLWFYFSVNIWFTKGCFRDHCVYVRTHISTYVCTQYMYIYSYICMCVSVYIFHYLAPGRSDRSRTQHGCFVLQKCNGLRKLVEKLNHNAGTSVSIMLINFAAIVIICKY